MKEIIIADTSCLIVLQRIDSLHLLNLVFGRIKVTTEVKEEFGEHLPEWFEVVSAKDEEKKRLIELNLDKGEASSIAFCLEQNEDCLLIIDERKGRKIALELGLKIAGTLGVVLKAKENGLIPSIREILEKLVKVDFRISPALKEEILRDAGETE